MVVRQILVLFVEVRILVGQQVDRSASLSGFVFSVAGELRAPERTKKQTSPALAGRGHLGNANARRNSAGRRYEAGDNPRGATSDLQRKLRVFDSMNKKILPFLGKKMMSI